MPDLSQPFRYLDLGCGSGFSCALLAAANPQGEFIGIDFSPDHILQAREIAAAAQIRNVRFIEASFADILQRPEEIGEIDMLACHGVYTWVSAENRRAIVEIMRRHVTTGGIVYLGYNTLPGWAPILPFRDLLLRLAEGRTPAGAQAAIGEAREVFELLKACGAGYLHDNAPLVRWLESLQDKHLSYLAHEYLPEPAGAVWHDEVVRDLSAARLTYVGSARLVENFDSINIAEGLRARVARGDEQGIGEMVRDLAVNQTFRRDVFTRGTIRKSAADADAAFLALGIAATEPPPHPPVIKTGQGEVPLAEAATAPVLQLIARGPTTIGNLVDCAMEQGLERQQARQVVTALLAGDIVTPVATLTPSDEALANCDAFNRAAMARAGTGGTMPALASPVLGNGVALGVPEQLALAGEAPEQGAADLDDDERQQLSGRLGHLRARTPYLRQLRIAEA